MKKIRPSKDEFWDRVRKLVENKVTIYSLKQKIASHPSQVTDTYIDFHNKGRVFRKVLDKQYLHLVAHGEVHTNSGIRGTKSGDMGIIYAALEDLVIPLDYRAGVKWATVAKDEKPRRVWSSDEVEFIVSDYFTMLRIELAGKKLDKTAHRKALRLQLDDRSGQAIEFKHCNISAVLRDTGLTYIEGYKPRGNLQKLLADAVDTYLIENSDLAVVDQTSIDSTESQTPFDLSEPMSDDPTKRKLQWGKERLGQRRFRIALLDLYEETCAITGHGPQFALDAAHIQPHSDGGSNSLNNGLLLRADIHKLFDKYWISINPKTFEVVISSRLQGSPYWDWNGTVLRKRKKGKGPSEIYLAEHFAKFH